MKKVRFRIGNTYRLIPKNERRGARNKHGWSAYISIVDEENNDVSNYIEKVMFKLHPTFKKPNRLVSQAPFELKSYGWGSFDIEIDVYWKPWLKMKKQTFEHELIFEESGSETCMSISVLKTELEKVRTPLLIKSKPELRKAKYTSNKKPGVIARENRVRSVVRTTTRASLWR